MIRKYNLDNSMGIDVIWYEENGARISFTKDESNSDFQRYLRWLENPDAEESGTLS